MPAVPAFTRLRLWSFLAMMLCPLAADARTPVITKLHGRSGGDQASFGFGLSVAANGQFILVGEPFNSQQADAAGAAHLYNARTGRYLRKLTAPSPAQEDFFGDTVALSGNYAIVGAYGVNDRESRGAAFVFDARNGRLLHRLEAPDGEGGDLFANLSMEASGGLVLIGAHGDDTARGAAYVFDLRTGEFLSKFVADDGVAGDGFGIEVALCGDLALVGAPDKNGQRGAAYLFDARSGRQLRKFVAPGGPDDFSFFGRNVMLDGEMALIGGFAYFDDFDVAFVVNVRTGTIIERLDAPTGAPNESFAPVALSGHLAYLHTNFPTAGTHIYDLSRGAFLDFMPDPGNATGIGGASRAVSVCGNLAVFGDDEDDDLGNNAGAAYFYRSLVGPLPLTTLTQTRSYAPGTVEAEFRRFQSPVINADGEVAFCAQLMGPGSGGNRDKGVWSDLGGFTDLLAKSREELPMFGSGVSVRTVGPPLCSQTAQAVFPGFLSGPGINGLNNRVLFNHDGTSRTKLFQSGDPITQLDTGDGSPAAQVFTEVTQKRGAASGEVGVAYRLRSGLGGVTPTNDTGILVLNENGTVAGSEAREGTEALNGDTFAQFFGRVAQNNSSFFAHSAWVRPAAGGRALQQAFSNNNAGTHYNVARQGDGALLRSADPADSATFRSMLGEGMQGNFGLVRASVVPDADHRGITEGIWKEGGALALVLKGEEFAAPGTFLSQIRAFWPVGSDKLVLLIKLAGPAVNPSNDCAVALAWYRSDVNDWELEPLLREGDEICDRDGTKVRAIQRVEVDPLNGNYAIVAALTGSPARNQALFTGNALVPHPSPNGGNGEDASFPTVLNRASLALRKGTLYNTASAESTRLRSILLEPRIDRTGSGGKGLGSAVNENGEVTLCLSFDDGAKELVVGKP